MKIKTDKEALAESIDYLHHLSQFLGIFGHTMVPEQADTSHTNMEWNDKEGRLYGQWSGGTPKIRMFLQFKDALLGMQTEQKTVLQPSESWSPKEIIQWMESRLAFLSNQPAKMKLDLPYDFKDFEVNDQPYIIPDNKYLCHWGRMLGQFQHVIEQLTKNEEHTGATRVWPHHFDLGNLIILSKNEQGEATETIGLGLAIPDHLSREPYGYINYFNKEKKLPADRPSLVYGHWVDNGMQGIICPITEFHEDTIEQEKEIKKFLSEGIEAIKSMR